MTWEETFCLWVGRLVVYSSGVLVTACWVAGCANVVWARVRSVALLAEFLAWKHCRRDEK